MFTLWAFGPLNPSENLSFKHVKSYSLYSGILNGGHRHATHLLRSKLTLLHSKSGLDTQCTTLLCSKSVMNTYVRNCPSCMHKPLPACTGAGFCGYIWFEKPSALRASKRLVHHVDPQDRASRNGPVAGFQPTAFTEKGWVLSHFSWRAKPGQLEQISGLVTVRPRVQPSPGPSICWGSRHTNNESWFLARNLLRRDVQPSVTDREQHCRREWVTQGVCGEAGTWIYISWDRFSAIKLTFFADL